MNRVSGIGYWVLRIGHRVLGPGDPGRGTRDAGSCVVVSLCLCAIASAVYAQDAIEIESNLVTVESELELEDLLAARETAAVETQTHLSAGQEVRSNEPAARLRQDSFDPSALRESVSDEPTSEVIAEEDVLKINQTLRRVIEQNRRLQDEKALMEQELGRLRGESRVADKRRKELLEKVSAYEDRVQQAMEVQQTLDETVADIKSKVRTREESLLVQIRDLQQQLEMRILESHQDTPQGPPTSAADSGPANPAAVRQAQKPAERAEQNGETADYGTAGAAADIAAAQQQGLDVIRLIDNLDQMRQAMSQDEARIHYNMGTIFFHQGSYTEAAVEYQKAVELRPQDADSHFNLALVAGDYLNEYERALTHYQQYLFLNPGAEDAPLVREKILEAQLYIRSWEDKDVDRETHADRPGELYTW